MKKKLSSLLVFALVLTMLAPAFAFAAVPSDVKGTASESAVAKLSALGVLSGYPDGTFKPSNTITRAEFAKIVAYEAGFARAAELLGKSDTNFKDVKASHWASGYIAVASSKGYLKGYPDGTFKPEAKVTNAEVATVLLRVLGYSDQGLVGTWPSNYIIKADEVGLLEGASFVSGSAAVRGDVAVFASNALDIELVTYDKDLNDFRALSVIRGGVASYVTLIEKAFSNVNVFGDILLAKNVNSDGKIVFKNATDTALEGFTVVGGNTLADLFGHEVVVVEVDGKVAVVRDAQSASKVVSGTLNSNLTVSNATYGTGLVALKGETTNRNVAQGSQFVVNGEFVGAANVTIPANSSATLFLDGNGNVRFIDASSYAINGAVFTSAAAGTSYRLASIVSSTATFALENNATITLNGAAAKLADLKANDVLYVKENLAGNAVSVEAVRTTVSGKIVKVTNDSAFTIDGKVYAKADNYVGPVLALNNEVTFFLNKDGKVATAKLASATTTTATGVVTDAVTVQVLVDQQIVSRDKVTFVNAANETKIYYVDPALKLDLTAHKHHLVTLTFNDKGEVSGKTMLADSAAVSSEVANVGADTLTVATTTYKVTSSTLIFDVTGITYDKASVTTLSKIGKADKIVYGVNANGLTLDYILFTQDNNATVDAAATVSGLYVSKTKETTVNGTVYTLTLKVNGQDVVLNTTGTVYAKDFTNAVLVKAVDSDTTNNAGSSVYDDAVIATATTVTAASTSNGTFTAGSDYVVTSDSKVVVIDANGNVFAADFASIVDAVNAPAADVAVYVVDHGKTLGTYKVAGTVVIKKLK